MVPLCACISFLTSCCPNHFATVTAHKICHMCIFVHLHFTPTTFFLENFSTEKQNSKEQPQMSCLDELFFLVVPLSIKLHRLTSFPPFVFHFDAFAPCSCITLTSFLLKCTMILLSLYISLTHIVDSFQFNSPS